MKELVRWILLYLGLPWITTGWLIGFGLLMADDFDTKRSWKEIVFWTYLSHYVVWGVCLVVMWAFTP